MPTLLEITPANSSMTSAAQAAAANCAANLRALADLQPRLADQVQCLPTDVEWVFGRDGFLTAREAGQWWSGCSLPRRAATRMLRTMDASAPVACLLNPAHAAQVRVALDMLQRPQGIIALLPDLRATRILLACDDFSQEIEQHRLWLAWGERWEHELRLLLEANAGLPTPQQFVRPVSADSSIADGLVGPAQRIFAEESARRATLVRRAREGWGPRASSQRPRLCVVAPTHFRLWDDAGDQLRSVLCNSEQNSHLAIGFDPDDPASSSPVALAHAAVKCDGIVTPNSGRADVPDVIPLDMPWITWITSPRIPLAKQRGPRDALLVADPAWRKSAIEAGWPADHVELAGWPGDTLAPADSARGTPTLAMVCDARRLDPPTSVTEYSSQAILWNAIVEELLRDPFQLTDPDAYLTDRMGRMQIPAEGLDRACFVQALIDPAFQQGLCRVLRSAGLPVRCYGRSWQDLPDFEPIAEGPVRSRDHLHRIAATSSALIHPMPFGSTHPIEALGCPLVRSHGSRPRFLDDARLALAKRGKSIVVTTTAVPSLTTSMVLHAHANAVQQTSSPASP